MASAAAGLPGEALVAGAADLLEAASHEEASDALADTGAGSTVAIDSSLGSA